MLSDIERRRLAAIESGLRTDDPEFVARFTVGNRRSRADGWRGPVAVAAFLATVTAVGIGLYALAAFIVVIATIAAVRLWVLDWLDRSTRA
jgi:hypothetical protein